MGNPQEDQLSGTRMSDDVEQALLGAQRECTFMWTNVAGEPFGVVMSYLTRDGKFYLNTQGGNARTKALGRSPRAAICINSAGSRLGTGKTITYKGTCRVSESRELKDWFFDTLSRTLMPEDEKAAEAYRAFLDGPGKVIIEFEPDYRLGFDAAAMSVLRPGRNS